MEEWRQIIKSFSELRGKYPDIETAIEMVCVTTKSDIEEVLSVLSMTGVYVPPGPEEDEIKCFINSAGKTKTVSELVRAVGFTFVISNEEALRLVKKWFTGACILREGN